MLLYNKMYKMGELICKMAKEGNLEEIDEITRNKTDLIEKILRFEKTTKMTEEEKTLQIQTRKKIEQLEKSNIELLTSLKKDLKNELHRVSKGKKVIGAYLLRGQTVNSTIDVSE